ncbi:aldehyde dehydrogenase family protein [Agrobacterium vitis]|uniref:aldehyde dehydrogenase (NADP(+)) n=1 Tax=Rhizobium/Agrobacterium group TaxID=227290 RepID=UPI0008FB9C8D|nr:MULTISPECIES: aldehyde dehydrogenase (NADP(+)) [Rhizobium/Agrobacterium group]MCF1433990.1 aldehyde dehydrogenase (NADP(+)) [Allorhizobium ampelinum]MCF1470338.1 aldehyde dehydrogenase (NADP(+)) [Allorhizobium ampelinum]MUO91828.1 aldehyde dehydrogenase family protein [Agrobacterium vitis]MUZ54728.1 aldehyde dehydrogenase family protein [Agrobacterium vitis]MUZ94314.1 aldehyde dehydrogenase family protein [Agrobacterium vitis]
MTLNLTGKHLIAGEWVEGTGTFTSSPASGESHTFFLGSAALVDRAMKAAEQAFASYGYSSREERAKFLEAIAEEIDARGDEITKIGTQETGLPEARLIGERGRTTGQLRLFADHIRKGDYLDRRHDAALPERQPLPRPDIRLMQRPIGPVGVFGASNFPLAFSTAGGDTASALAAGCPVVVKGHEAHPGTAEIVAQAIHAAIKSTGVHPGTFSLVQGGNRETGEAICLHPLTRAVGFTGSLRGGRALFDLCVRRDEPIPFFGELGSVNPMFLLPAAVSARGEAIAKGWAGSLTMGAGQFCTNPGIAIIKAGPEADAFLEAAKTALAAANAQTMLTDGIANAYREGAKRIEETSGVQSVLTSTCDLRNAKPYLFATTGENWLANHVLSEEVFGPLGVFVTVKDEDEMVGIAESLVGQLTTTLQMDDADAQIARKLLPILERKSGRVLANGFPTGVEVCDAMVHGGPYPATTNFGATSVGTMAIRRFLRPVSYQNIPVALLPEDLQ